MKILFVLLFSMSAFFGFAQEFKGIPTGEEKIATANAEFEKEVFTIVNDIRKKRGKKALKWNESLAHAARYHGMDMAQEGYFDHDSKDLKKNGQHKKVCDVFERMRKFVPKNIFTRSENIAAGDRTPEEVVKGWMSSRGHRRNILDKDAKYLGVGYIELEDSEYQTYWVQNFGM